MSSDPSLLIEDADWQENSEQQLYVALDDLDDRGVGPVARGLAQAG